MGRWDLIEREFNKQAPQFEAAGFTLSDPHYLDWVIENLTLNPHWRVLDAGAGTGILSRAISSHVRQVFSLEIAEQMIAHGKEELLRGAISNVLFIRGSASEMPYEDNRFDLVATRFTIHHFKEPRAEFSEMVRVCREGGRVAIIDLISPDDAGLSASYNELERLRDPSHVRALSKGELENLMKSAGLQILRQASRDVPVEVDRWLDLTATEAEARQKIVKLLTAELEGKCVTGMRPFIKDQKLRFTQTWAIILGAKATK